MKKTVLCIAIAFLLLFVFVNNTSASVSTSNSDTINAINDYCSIPSLKEIGEINNKNTVMINGVENPLYCTFADPGKAIENLKLYIPQILKNIADAFHLDAMNVNNWREYREKMENLLSNSMTKYNESDEDMQKLREFFDIYENYEENENIINELNKLNNIKSISSNDKAKLGILFPYYAPIAEEANNIIKQERVTNSLRSSLIQPMVTINISSALSYAVAHATSRNTTDYASFDADCTNFASQILEAGGVSQVVYDSVYSGWWHKKVRKCVLFVCWDEHTNSRSWSVADTFARYMGVTYTTKDHYAFSANILRGDFIAADWTSDGNWDHVAFVTDRLSSAGTYNGKTYYNYKVAQHTSDYNAWTSYDENHWENPNNENWTYARVRR